MAARRLKHSHERAAWAYAESMMSQPTTKTFDGQASGQHVLPSPSETANSLVRKMLLAADSSLYVKRGMFLCVSPQLPIVSAKLSNLGECAESDCGCSRLLFPHVRPLFRKNLVAMMSSCMRGRGKEIRYVSVGSGLMLYDLELLCGLQEAGFRVKSVVFVDNAFGGALGPEARELCERALHDVGAFMAPTRVAMYTGIGPYALACLRGEEPLATTFVQADAAKISHQDTTALAAIALSPGHLGFRLNNKGQQRGATMDVWERVPVLTTSLRGPLAPSMSSLERAQQLVRHSSLPNEQLVAQALQMVQADELLTDVIVNAQLG
jgi:hypothetical protein